VQSPPSLSRHFLIPASESSVAFCHLLLETLRSEKLVALVFLGKDWFGLLQYVADKEHSCMPPMLVCYELRLTAWAAIALSLLPPSASLPGLGKVSELLPNHKIVEASEGAPLPPVAWKSFLTGGKGSYVMPTLYAESVKQDLAKIVRFARNLPAKKENLAAEYPISFSLPSYVASVGSKRSPRLLASTTALPLWPLSWRLCGPCRKMLWVWCGACWMTRTSEWSGCSGSCREMHIVTALL
jgi:hypothetical protein